MELTIIPKDSYLIGILHIERADSNFCGSWTPWITICIPSLTSHSQGEIVRGERKAVWAVHMTSLSDKPDSSPSLNWKRLVPAFIDIWGPRAIDRFWVDVRAGLQPIVFYIKMVKRSERSRKNDMLSIIWFQVYIIEIDESNSVPLPRVWSSQNVIPENELLFT